MLLDGSVCSPAMEFSAAPFAIAIGGTWPERTLVWLGLSGGAILLERLTSQEEKKDDVVLR